MAQQQSIAVVWFRTGDLRISDHEPLHQATQSATTIVPFYNLDDSQLRPPVQHQELSSSSSHTTLGLPATGPHRLIALLRAIHSLRESLSSLGSGLLCSAGSTEAAVRNLTAALAENVRPVSLSLHYYQGLLPKEIDSSNGSIDGSLNNRGVGEEDGEEKSVVKSFLETAAECGVPAHIHAVSSGHSLFKLDDISSETLDMLRKCGTMTDVRRSLHSTTVVRLPYAPPSALPPLPECCSGSSIQFGRAPLPLPLPLPSLLPLPSANNTTNNAADNINTAEISTIRALYQDAGAGTALQNLENLVGSINLDSIPPPMPGVAPPAATEPEAAARLHHLLSSPEFKATYRESRMAAGAIDGSAMLSLALSLGTISPRTVYWETLKAMLELEEEVEVEKNKGEDAAPAADAAACVQKGLEVVNIVEAPSNKGAKVGEAADNPAAVHNKREAELVEWKWRDPTVASPGHHWLLMHLGIRDFFLLYASHCMSTQSSQKTSSEMAVALEDEEVWQSDPEHEVLTAWAQGKTGFPYIDANMRQLAATGYMSNRGRQNVASFLSKALHINWRLGAELFRALLIDHDPAVNQSSWAYVAGAGADPRQNREFKTVTQGERYDPQAEFITAWVPELKNLPVALRHRPWEQEKKEGKEEEGGVREGVGVVEYPLPIVAPEGQIGKGPKKKKS